MQDSDYSVNTEQVILSVMYFRASIVLVSIIFVSQRCIETTATENNSATPKIIATENSDGSCHCQTELTLNIPPCVCAGTVEAVQEIHRLKSDIQELLDKCSTVNANLTRACKLLKLLVDNCEFISHICRQLASSDTGWCSLDQILVVHSYQWMA